MNESTVPPPGASSPAADTPEARLIVDALRTGGGASVQAIVLFGSQLVQASPDRHSAWDLVVVVDAYGPFHRALVSAGHHRRPAWLLSLLAHVLPPNITAFDAGGGAPLAKCAIVSLRHLRRALGPHAPDHFLKGRMIQRVEVLWAVDEDARAEVERALVEARLDVLSWVAPYLVEPLTAAALARRVLEVSYGAELRPESGERVGEVFRSQHAFLEAVAGQALLRGVSEGTVSVVSPGLYRLTRRPRWGARLRRSAYFTWSKTRATARWLKHVVTFNDWLTYVQRKAERRTGMEIEITRWERRLPLLLLWPKVVRVLRRQGTTGTKP